MTIAEILKKDKVLIKKNNLVRISNGKEEILYYDITVTGKSEIGISKPKIVMLSNGKRAFWKDSTRFDDSDDLEIVINYVGNVFGVKMAEEYRIFTYEGMKNGLVSIDVSNNNHIPFRTMEECLIDVADNVKNGFIKVDSWMEKWIEITKQRAFPNVPDNMEYAGKSIDDYYTAVELPLNITKSCFKYAERSHDKFFHEYIRMILFDLMTGQTDRTMNNYGINISNEQEYVIAPLFDNSTLSKPYLPENAYALNGVVFDRDELARVLFDKYPDYVKIPAQHFVSSYQMYRDEFMEIANKWIDNENCIVFYSNLEKGYNRMLRHMS